MKIVYRTENQQAKFYKNSLIYFPSFANRIYSQHIGASSCGLSFIRPSWYLCYETMVSIKMYTNSMPWNMILCSVSSAFWNFNYSNKWFINRHFWEEFSCCHGFFLFLEFSFSDSSMNFMFVEIWFPSIMTIFQILLISHFFLVFSEISFYSKLFHSFTTFTYMQISSYREKLELVNTFRNALN